MGNRYESGTGSNNVRKECRPNMYMELCKGGELFDMIVSRGHYSERVAAVVTCTIVKVVQVCCVGLYF